MDARNTRIMVDLQKGSAPSLVLKAKRAEEKRGNLLHLGDSLHGPAIYTPRSRKRRARLLDTLSEMDNITEVPRETSEIFLPIDEKKYKRRSYGSELARVAAVGMIMLGLFHGINIYQRGDLLKEHVLVSAAAGYEGLLEAGKKVQSTATLLQAEDDFQKATSHFEEALELVRFLNVNQNIAISHETTVQSLQGILQAGKVLSEAGTDFMTVLGKMQDLPLRMLEPIGNVENLDSKNAPTEEPKVDLDNQPSLTEELKADLEILKRANDKLEIAKDYLALVDKNLLPSQLRPKFTEGQKKLDTVLSILASAQEKIPVFLKLLGDRYPHRYLILLQNDTEARPTGGFIGSYLLVDANDGRIENMQFHDVYVADGQLKTDDPAIQVPEDIAKITKVWRLRDANYSPDFAISAEKAAWFLQKQYGPSVDSVLALNQSFLRDLFELTGPITLEGLSSPLTKENYQTILSYIVESKLDGVEDPKQILRSFIPAFQKKLFTTASLQQTFTMLLEGLRRKDILMYSRDQEIQELFTSMGFAGKVYQARAGEDYLNVINTSIGGNKSDLYMKQRLTHVSSIAQSGVVTDELSITREHGWNEQAAQSLKSTLRQFGFTALPEPIAFVLGSGRNKSVVKVYVPLGSKLLAAKNMDMKEIAVREDQDLQKTFFMFEMEVEAGSSRTVKLSYELPASLNLQFADTYKLFVQKQPGLVPTTLIKNIFFTPEFRSLATYPPTFEKKEQMLTLERNIETDFHLAALIAR